MPFPSISDPVPGTVITAAWEIANPLQAIRWLRQLMGNADPAGSNLVVVSSSTSAAAWGQVPTDAIAAGAVTDAKLALAKVQRTAPQYASFSAALVELSSFCWINNAGSVADAPIPATLDWLLMQIRHPSTGFDYRWQLTCSMTDQNELYTRSVVAGSAGPWRKIAHTGNIDPLPKAGGTMTGSIAFADTLEGVILSGGGHLRDDGATSTQLVANGNVFNVYTEANALMASITAGGIVAPRFVSDVAVGTSPYSCTSTTLNTNLNADLLDNLHAGHGLNQIPYNDGLINPNLNAGLLDGSTKAEIIAAAAGGGVPSGVIAAVRTAAEIPATWTRETNLDGRMPVGAGTTFSVTFVENTNYGASWAHTHTDSGHSHSGAGLGVGGTVTVGGASGTSTRQDGSNAVSATSHTHTASHDLDVSGNTEPAAAVISTDAWLIPSRAVVWIRKS